MIQEITASELNAERFIDEKVAEIRIAVGAGTAINALSGGIHRLRAEAFSLLHQGQPKRTGADPEIHFSRRLPFSMCVRMRPIFCPAFASMEAAEGGFPAFFVSLLPSPPKLS